MTEQPSDLPSLLDDYRAQFDPGHGFDELVDDSGVRPASVELASRMNHIGLRGLLDRRTQAGRFVQDDGVTYGGAANASWRLDPLPLMIAADDWAGLERGLVQRAELLDLVLADLYGPRELLRRGVIPPEVVLGHGGFVHQADGIRVPGRRQLFFTATDLARDRDGRWHVLSDRTQAPSGAGYAMENRRVVAKVFPGLRRNTELSALRDFFHSVRMALHEVAPRHVEAPRIVLLTPGAESETAFDQAYLSTLLGFPLVEAEDLIVSDGQVFLRNLGRLEPVDVLLRRVDADYTDPLELRPESRLGVPGLLEASRQGTVTVVNTFGTGVLENPGLFPFLPAAARALLGTDLELPSVATWWCGDAAQRSHVLANLDSLVIKPITRGVGVTARFGTELGADDRDVLRRAIEAQPWAWAAQELLEKSTTPVVTPLGMEPRDVVLRTFGVARGGSYTMMRGGLARVAPSAGSQLVSNLSGALTKDVWVLAPEGSQPDAWQPDPTLAPPALEVPALAGGLSPRTAEDLFWLGRYAERAEGTARLLRVADDLTEDFAGRPGTSGHATLMVLLEAVTRLTGAPGGPDLPPDRVLQRLAMDPALPGSVLYAARRTISLAQALREQLSLDTWLVLGRLERAFDNHDTETSLQPVLAQTVESMLAFSGLAAESLVRDQGWHFLDAGRRLERAQHLVGLVRHTLGRSGEQPPVEPRVLEAVLMVGESVITHRRREAAGPLSRSPQALVLDLLLLDVTNPRGLAFQLERLEADLIQLPATGSDRVGVLIHDLTVRLTALDPDLPPSADWLGGLDTDLRELSRAVERAHFVHKAPQHALPGTWGPQWAATWVPS
ncbi:circularly permuted type 2 ATP-grasp protein [Nocardioides sp.]|uniref:circularly permuted type 2 ATP-grasp protein n=1 Tax=Nocardioides sp. TaxID=35761 RepID=UPI003D120564